MYYKNVSLSVKTFHGVTFKPGEIKEVSQNINHKLMILVSDEEGKKATKIKVKSTEEASPQLVKQQKPSSEKPKKTESEAVIQPANDDIKSED